MMKRSLIILMVIYCYTNTYGNRNIRMDETIKKGLIILVIEENEVVLKGLKKPEEKKFYKEGISTYNTLIKKHAGEYLTYYNEIKYKTVDEIADMSLESRRKYTYLCYAVGSGPAAPNFYEEIDPGEEKEFLSSYRSLKISEKGPRYAALILCGKKPNKKGEKSNPKDNTRSSVLHIINSPSIIVEEWSIVSVLKNLEFLLQSIKGEKVKAVTLLKGKTLLVSKDQLNKKLTEEKLKTVYTSSCEVVSKETFLEKLKGKEDKYIYIIPTPTNVSIKAQGGGATMSGLDYANFVIDNASGRIITTPTTKNKISIRILKWISGKV